MLFLSIEQWELVEIIFLALQDSMQSADYDFDYVAYEATVQERKFYYKK